MSTRALLYVDMGSYFRANYGSVDIEEHHLLQYLRDCPELQVCLLVPVLQVDPIKTTRNNHTGVLSHCDVLFIKNVLTDSPRGPRMPSGPGGPALPWASENKKIKS